MSHFLLQTNASEKPLPFSGTNATTIARKCNSLHNYLDKLFEYSFHYLFSDGSSQGAYTFFRKNTYKSKFLCIETQFFKPFFVQIN